MMEEKLAEQDRPNILSSLPEKTRNIISNSVAALLILMLIMLIVTGYRTVAARYAGYTETEMAMNAPFEIKVNGMNAGANVKSAFARISELDKLLNYFDDKSEITSINNMAGISAVAVNKDTFELIDRAYKFSGRTGGAYDLTIGPLADIWRAYLRDKNSIPSGNELIYAQHLVNYGNIQLNSQNETVKLMYPGMKMYLEDIDRGYAISKARTLLVDKGVKSAVITSGNIVAAIGDNNGKPWKVGIKHPRKADEQIGTVTLAAGQAISTTADYDNYFEMNGKRYHDIFDPLTGMPAIDVQSVSVICDDATDAVLLSRAIFVMGPTRGMAFISTLKDTFAVIVDKDGKVTTSPGLTLER
jgi:FAD:protein FMN transferase